MEDFTLIKKDGTLINLISKDPYRAITKAVQDANLMGNDTCKLSVVSSDIINFQIGDKINVHGNVYSIRNTVKKTRTLNGTYLYEIIFYGALYDLMKTLYRNASTLGMASKSSFDLTLSLKDFVKLIIDNLNRDYPNLWFFDENNCPESSPITMQFNNQNCLNVLQTLCSKFKYEFRIEQKNGIRTIKLGKFGEVVYPPNAAEAYEWGKGNGLYELTEQQVNDKSLVTRLWVNGGSQNIKSDYRGYTDRLQLPLHRLNKNRHVLNDGTTVEAGAEYIGITNEELRFIENNELKNKVGSIESAKNYDDIYPKRTGIVSSTENRLSFVDSTMDFDLNESNENGTLYLINGVAAKIIFVTGRLAGQQFEISKYNHTEKKFTIIEYKNERGLTFPNDTFVISSGDKYKIVDINMPQSYIDNAEEELWYTAIQEFQDLSQPQAKYSLKLDPCMLSENLPNGSNSVLFHVGDYIPVKDERFGIDKNMKITKLTRDLLQDQDYNITLSDSVAISINTKFINDVLEHNTVLENNRLYDIIRARRGWRTTEELRTAIFDTDGFFDPENIKPNSISTNMLTVGTRSQQFLIKDTVFQANYNGDPNHFVASSGVLVHLSIDPTRIVTWNLSSCDVNLTDNTFYYVYAKCSKSSNVGVFHITHDKIKFNSPGDQNNYYFMIGVISSLNQSDNFRDFTTTYGFTRINGKTITTGRIVTSDGKCYLDLDGNLFHIGDENSFLSWENDRLLLKGVLVQSNTGETSELSVFRGVYNSNKVYSKGDEVSYNSGGEICTYRYIFSSPSAGHSPAESNYWLVVAKGSKGNNGVNGIDGKDGKGLEFIFKRQVLSTPPAIPNSLNNDDYIPPGWTDNQQGVTIDEQYEFVSKRTKINDTWGEFSTPALWAKYSEDPDYLYLRGTGGDKGFNVPAIVSSKKISQNKTGRGLHLYKINRETLEITYVSVYDTYNNNTDEASRFCHEINEITDNYFVGIVSADAYNIIGEMEQELKENFGASSVPQTDGKSRTPFAFLSYKGMPKGYGISVFTAPGANSPFAEISVYVANRAFISSRDGKDGENGKSPSLVYRGDYLVNETYHSTDNRRDAVKFNGIYYITKLGVGSFSGKLPTNSEYWENFGAQFSSIATNLALIENANIANFIYKDQTMQSQSKTGGKPNLMLDGLNGIINALKGSIGSFQLNDGDIIGKLNGHESIKITTKLLPEIENLIGWKDLTNGISNDFSFNGDIYQYSDNLYDDIDENGGSTKLNSQASISIDVDNSCRLCIDGQFGLNNVVSDVSYTNELYCRVVSSTGLQLHNGVMQSDRVYVELPSAGRYIITISCLVALDTQYVDRYSFSAQCYFNLSLTISTGAQETILASDGLLSYFGVHNFLKYQQNDGFTVQMGLYGIKVTGDNGIQKTVNGGNNWTTL